MDCLYRLDELAVGETATVFELKNDTSLRRRLRDMGLIEGTVLTCVGKNPIGSPSAYLIRGTVIAIRAADAARISVKKPNGKEV